MAIKARKLQKILSENATWEEVITTCLCMYPSWDEYVFHPDVNVFQLIKSGVKLDWFKIFANAGMGVVCGTHHNFTPLRYARRWRKMEIASWLEDLERGIEV